MKRNINSVKIKVLLGYLTLVILGSLMFWITYTEIRYYSARGADLYPASGKFLYINNILTNLYQAEGLERSFARSGQTTHYSDYVKLMDSISGQIDTLATMLNIPAQHMHTDSIKKLLRKKQQNLKELVALKKQDSSSARYRQALEKLAAGKDTIDPFLKVSKNVTTNLDSIYVRVKKKNFFERLANVFSGQKTSDSALEIRTIQSVRIDSIIYPSNPADTIAGLITAVISRIKDDSIAMQSRVKQKEEEILANDLTLTHQLRQMLSSIEKEELISSYQKVQEQQSRIERKTILIIMVGFLALLTIMIFLVNILKDITKSQHYRQRLEEAKAYSESLLRSKEQLMLSLTHDLKSPLNSIMGYSEFMQEDKALPAKQKAYLQNITRASEHMLKLITDLLDLARLESGKLSIDQLPFSLKTLVDEITDGFRPQASAKNIDLKLKYNLSDSLLHSGDPVRITQILSNLISNALKFTDQGRVTVEVSQVNSNEYADEIRFDITDTGIGIPADKTRYIFEEFTTVSDPAKHYEGSGLGLTITKKLIELMHGTINAESKPGEGSRFTVVLPLVRAIHRPDTGMVSVQKQDTVRAVSGSTVWVIDDDQTLLDMITSILMAEGINVQCFTDPHRAIHDYKKGSANLIITDIRMPGLSGTELIKQLKEKENGPLRSVAITGSHPGKISPDEFCAILHKPFKPQELLEIVTQQIRQSISDAGSGVQPKGYSLVQLEAFAGGDPETLKQILTSFVMTGKQDALRFRQYLKEWNHNELAELSHKMLTLFRHLEANQIAELLSRLEKKDPSTLINPDYFKRAEAALDQIENLLDRIERDENIMPG